MGSGDTIGSVKNSHKNLLFQNITNNYLISELTAKEIVIKKVCDCAQSSSKNNDKGRIIGSRTDVESELAEYRKKNKNKIVFTTPNINSIKNKSFEVSEIVSNNIDVLIFSKFDAISPEGKFFIPGNQKSYRRDRDKHRGGF